MDVIDVIAAPLVAAAIAIFVGAGVVFVTNDVRHFSTIVKECKEQGRLQDHNIRILCQVEERK